MSTTTATYRKTRQGQWVAFAPAAHLAGAIEQFDGKIQVTKKSGTTKVERVTSVGKTFTVDGVKMAYGYLDADFVYAPVGQDGPGSTYDEQPEAPQVRTGRPCHYCGLPTRRGFCDECGYEI